MRIIYVTSRLLFYHDFTTINNNNNSPERETVSDAINSKLVTSFELFSTLNLCLYYFVTATELLQVKKHATGKTIR